MEILDFHWGPTVGRFFTDDVPGVDTVVDLPEPSLGTRSLLLGGIVCVTKVDHCGVRLPGRLETGLRVTYLLHPTIDVHKIR